MATRTTKRLSELSGEELGELIGLMSGSDSVELKVTLPASEHRGAIAALGLDPLDAQIRQVFFFDTPDLALYKSRRRRSRAPGPGPERRLGREAAAGRARRAAGGRPAVGEHERRGRRDAGRLRLLRVDEGQGPERGRARGRPGHPPGEQGVLEGAARLLRRARAGGPRAEPAQHPRPDLRPQGDDRAAQVPAQDRRRGLAAPGRPAHPRAVDEVRPNEAFQVAVETRSYLEGLGLDLAADPQTKTKASLDFFSKQLAREGAEEAASPS